MSCDFAEKISLLIDGELTPTEAQKVESHLAGCVQCQEARADFLTMRRQISEYAITRELSAPRAALARLLSREPRRSPLEVLVGSPGLRPALAAAVLLIVVSIAGIIVFFSRRPTEIASNVTQENSGASKSVPRKQSDGEPAPTPSPTPKQRRSEPPAVEWRGQVVRNRTQTPKPDVTARISVPNTDSRRPAISERQSPQTDNTLDYGSVNQNVPNPRVADTETLTARHLEQSELLLRSFRNVRLAQPGESAEISYERQRAQRLVYQNILLRREADSSGDVQVTALLDSLEPILLDIANLPDKPHDDDVRAIKERLQRQNLVALLQVNSTAVSRAY